MSWQAYLTWNRSLFESECTYRCTKQSASNGFRIFKVGSRVRFDPLKLEKWINLRAAVERGKAVYAIDVHRTCTHCVVTLWVMSQFVHGLGAARGCADFRDPTAVFRFKQQTVMPTSDRMAQRL